VPNPTTLTRAPEKKLIEKILITSKDKLTGVGKNCLFISKFGHKDILFNLQTLKGRGVESIFFPII
jgi:hypothetical protein